MRILVVIDTLGSGGAQRQIVNLATGLLSRGHDVEAFVYFPRDTFFRGALEQAGIPIHDVVKGAGFSLKVVRRLVQLVQEKRYDGVISFLPSPNVYCELARLFGASFRLVVSERSSRATDKGRLTGLLYRLLHAIADQVVANSQTHAEWLRKFPWLRRKTRVIYNGYSIGEARPLVSADPKPPFKYIVIGRIHEGKNGARLIRALAKYHQRHGVTPMISWAGRCDSDAKSQAVFKEMKDLLAANPAVAANWRWLGERNDIPELLASHDALLHPSLYEGLPNVVCEAFIAARPVIISNVCDHAYLAGNGERGMLFDPLSLDSMCDAIECFERLETAERLRMGQLAREYAEKQLSNDRMVSHFEAVLLPPNGIP